MSRPDYKLGFLTEAGYHNTAQEGPINGSIREGCVPYDPSYVGSPLYRAVLLGDRKLVQILLSSGKHGSTAARGGRSLVTAAVLADGGEEMLELLLKHGAHPLVADHDGKTSLHYAAYKGLDACLKAVLQWCESRNGGGAAEGLVQGDKRGVTPLHHAAALPNTRCLAVMLKHLQPGMIDPQDLRKRTPLHWAASYSREAAIVLLVKNGANCHTPDISRRTPLHWAVLGHQPCSSSSNNTTHNTILKSQPSVNPNAAFIAASNTHKFSKLPDYATNIVDNVGGNIYKNNTDYVNQVSCHVNEDYKFINKSSNNTDNVRKTIDIVRCSSKNVANVGCSSNINNKKDHNVTNESESNCITSNIENDAFENDNMNASTASFADVNKTSIHAVMAVNYMARFLSSSSSNSPNGEFKYPCSPDHTSASEEPNVDSVSNRSASIIKSTGARHNKGLQQCHSSTASDQIIESKDAAAAVEEVGRGAAVGVGTNSARVACVTRLLQAAPTIINWQDHDGVSALHLSAEVSCADTTQALLQTSAQPSVVDIRDNQDRTPLHWAAIRGDRLIVRLLLSSGADLDAVDKAGGTPLHYSALHNHTDVVLLLSQQPGASGSAVEWAAAAQADQAIAVMVRHGAQLVLNNKHGNAWCPGLHVAAAKGHVSTVALILRLCRLPQSCNNDGTTPLHAAAHGGHVRCIKQLMSQGSCLHKADSKGRLPLHYAALAGHLYVTQLLIRAGTDVNAKDYYGRTSLHLTAHKGHLALLTLLLENKAQVDARDHQGVTALHCGAEAGHLGVLMALLTARANTNIVCYNTLQERDVTALDCAVLGQHEAVVAALLETGARPASEVLSAAATKLQRSWRSHQQRQSSDLVLHQRIARDDAKEHHDTNAVIVNIITTTTTAAVNTTNGSDDDTPTTAASNSIVENSSTSSTSSCVPPAVASSKVKPASLRVAESSVRRSRSLTKVLEEGRSCRLSLPLSVQRECVASALMRTARSHSSSRDLALPSSHCILHGGASEKEDYLSRQLHSISLHGLSDAVQYPACLAYAFLSTTRDTTSTRSRSNSENDRGNKEPNDILLCSSGSTEKAVNTTGTTSRRNSNETRVEKNTKENYIFHTSYENNIITSTTGSNCDKETKADKNIARTYIDSSYDKILNKTEIERENVSVNVKLTREKVGNDANIQYDNVRMTYNKKFENNFTGYHEENNEKTTAKERILRNYTYGEAVRNKISGDKNDRDDLIETAECSSISKIEDIAPIDFVTLNTNKAENNSSVSNLKRQQASTPAVERLAEQRTSSRLINTVTGAAVVATSNSNATSNATAAGESEPQIAVDRQKRMEEFRRRKKALRVREVKRVTNSYSYNCQQPSVSSVRHVTGNNPYNNNNNDKPG